MEYINELVAFAFLGGIIWLFSRAKCRMGRGSFRLDKKGEYENR